MQLETLLYYAVLLACPIGMGAMMWMMGKNMGGQKEQSMSDPLMPTSSSEERLTALRARRQALETEIAEVTKLAELEARAQELRQGVADVISPGKAVVALDGQI